MNEKERGIPFFALSTIVVERGETKTDSRPTPPS
jgi:hypothetical protein